MDLRVCDPLAITRPEWVGICELLRGSLGERPVALSKHVHYVDLKRRRLPRFREVSDVTRIRRPSGTFFGHLGSLRQIDNLTAQRRNHEQIPLLVAIMIGSECDPFPIWRPDGIDLSLIADG